MSPALHSPQVLWEAHPQMWLPQRLLRSHSVYTPFAWRNTTSSPEASIYLHVVKLDLPKVCPSVEEGSSQFSPFCLMLGPEACT